MRQDVVGDHHVGLAGRQLVGQFEGEELRDRRNTGLARLLRGTGGGVYAEAGDALLDEVTQEVAVIARDLDHQAVAAAAPLTDQAPGDGGRVPQQIGRASGRESVCPYV